MQPYPLPPNVSVQDRDLLDDIDAALGDLDRAFAHLSDGTFARLPKEYQRLADAVLRVYSARSHLAA